MEIVIAVVSACVNLCLLKKKGKFDAKVIGARYTFRSVKERLPTDSKLLTLKEAAEMLRVSVRTISRWIEKKIIPVTKIPGSRKYLIAREAIVRRLRKGADK